MTRYVVLGTGLLGWHLSRALDAAGVPHEALGHARIDDAGGLARAAAAAGLAPGVVVVNAAALTNVDACEDREEEAMRVNGEEPGALAARCADAGARLVHVSTDAVLDVTNVYARSKALGERRVREAMGEDALVLRVSTTFGPHPTRSDFVRWVLSKLQAGEPFSVLDDMVSSPTYAPDAARAVLALVAADVRGTQQFVNHPGLSRHAFALAVRRAWGLAGDIRPAKMAEFKGFRAPRPRDTSMASTVDHVVRPLPLDACLADYRERLSRA